MKATLARGLQAAKLAVGTSAGRAADLPPLWSDTVPKKAIITFNGILGTKVIKRVK